MLAGRFHRVFVLNQDHLVDDVDVQHVGNEAGADALNRVPARLERLAALRRCVMTGLFDRLDGDHLDRRLARLEHFADAGDRAAGADAADDDIDLPVGIAPDFLGRRLAVDFRDWPGS